MKSYTIKAMELWVIGFFVLLGLAFAGILNVGFVERAIGPFIIICVVYWLWIRDTAKVTGCDS
jgi:hypothetical protein